MSTRPVAANATFDTQALHEYCKKHVLGYPAQETLHVSQFTHGQSNPTYLLTIGTQRYVLRKKPAGKILPGAHAVEREYKVLAALAKTNVPVPRVFCLCQEESIIGTPFYIMSFVDGRIFKDPALPGMKQHERFAIYAEMNRVLGLLHRVNIQHIGLHDYGKIGGYVHRQVTTWTKQWNASKINETPQMEQLIQFLTQHMPKDGDETTLTHGDFRLDNLIFHPKECRVIAVLDWELSTLGHPLSDVAYVCMAYHNPSIRGSAYSGLANLPLSKMGIPEEPAFLLSYINNAHRGPLNHYHYFLALSYFRAAAILAGVYRRATVNKNASAANAEKVGLFYIALAKKGLEIANEKCLAKVPVAPTAYPLQHYLDTAPASLKMFNFSPKFWQLRAKLLQFMDEHVYPNEHILKQQHVAAKDPWTSIPIIEDLKVKAKAAGLWNLFLPSHPEHGGLTNLDYAPLCEITGRSIYLAPEALNCSAPDTGNMEVLARYGNKKQQETYLKPLLNGKIRSAFAMTEPNVASSDATNISLEIRKDETTKEYVINGRKWWISGACDPRCEVLIVMGKIVQESNSTGASDKSDKKKAKAADSIHKAQSMILVPMKTKGVRVVRPLSVFGYLHEPHGHAELEFCDVRVPYENILLGEGRGFEIAQGRLGPGRIHHCMRLIGMAERALEMMIKRTLTRSAFNTVIAFKGDMPRVIADSRAEIEQARLLTLQAAAMMDLVGNKVAAQQIAMIKVIAPSMCLRVIDRAVQAHGAAGVSDEFPLADWWANARTLRLADGPDEVHRETIAKLEVARAKL